MFSKQLYSALLFVLFISLLTARLAAQDRDTTVVILSDKVGEAIDQEERAKYEFFPQINGFLSAVLYEFEDGHYGFKVLFSDETSGKEDIKWFYLKESDITRIRETFYKKEYELVHKDKAGSTSPLVQKPSQTQSVNSDAHDILLT